jgi:hypothetical protein
MEVPIMRKQWLAAAVGLTLAIGMVTGTGLLSGADKVVVQPGWRYSDGYWNYWDPDDRAWYYTNGRAWYTYNNDAWTAYKFDKKFGNKAYREGYVVPKPGPDVVVPSHRVKVKVDD